jgi:hypothetical protein
VLRRPQVLERLLDNRLARRELVLRPLQDLYQGASLRLVPSPFEVGPHELQADAEIVGVKSKTWGYKSSSIARAASSSMSSRTWAYLKVIAGSEWPSNLDDVQGPPLP